MKTLHIIMPMAGEGSRFLKEGYTIPKPLIKCKDVELFRRAINSINTENIFVKYTFIVRQNHIDDYKIDKIIHNYFSNSNIFAIEKTTRGAVETCLIAEKIIKDDDIVLILDCDLEFKSKQFNDYIQNICNTDDIIENDGALVSFISNLSKYSYALVDNDNNVLKTAEKEVISNYALCGAYLFNSGKAFKDVSHQLLNEQNFKKPEYYISLLYNYLIKNGGHIVLTMVDEYYSYGTPEELQLYGNKSNYSRF